MLTKSILQGINITPRMVGGNLNGIATAFKDTAYPFIMAGFALAGLAVVRALVNKEENAKKMLISYLTALVVFFIIWNTV